MCSICICSLRVVCFTKLCTVVLRLSVPSPACRGSVLSIRTLCDLVSGSCNDVKVRYKIYCIWKYTVWFDIFLYWYPSSLVYIYQNGNTWDCLGWLGLFSHWKIQQRWEICFFWRWGPLNTSKKMLLDMIFMYWYPISILGMNVSNMVNACWYQYLVELFASHPFHLTGMYRQGI